MLHADVNRSTATRRPDDFRRRLFLLDDNDECVMRYARYETIINRSRGTRIVCTGTHGFRDSEKPRGRFFSSEFSGRPRRIVYTRFSGVPIPFRNNSDQHRDPFFFFFYSRKHTSLEKKIN